LVFFLVIGFLKVTLGDVVGDFQSSGLCLVTHILGLRRTHAHCHRRLWLL
jgi:hypothetical protein